MKKRVCLVLAVIMTLFVFSGCVRLDMHTKINTNGTYDISLVYAMHEEMLTGEDDSVMNQESIDEFIEKGFRVEEYNEDGYKGYIISASSYSPKTIELSDDDDVVGESFSMLSGFKEEKGIVSYYYETSDSDNEKLAMVEQYIAMTKGYVRYSFELPVKPIEHNATSVSEDGKTLYWNLFDSDFDGTISFSYKKPIDAALVAIIVIVIMLAAAGTVVFIIWKKKKKAAQETLVSCDEESVASDEPENAGTEENSKVKEEIEENIGANASAEESSTKYDELREYKKLLDEGVITQEDFDKKKEEILK